MNAGGKERLVGAFERWGQGVAGTKTVESKWLLLDATDAFEKGNERLRVMSHRLKAKYQSGLLSDT